MCCEDMIVSFKPLLEMEACVVLVSARFHEWLGCAGF